MIDKKDNITMNTLKIVFISLTTFSLAIPFAYADVGSAAGKAYFPDSSVRQKLIPPPAILEDRRVISRQRVDILRAQALTIADTENYSDSPIVQENKNLENTISKISR